MSYKQLTSEQRYTIYALKKRGETQTKIAETIGVHKSTVSREIKRNTGGRGYRIVKLTLIEILQFESTLQGFLEILSACRTWSPAIFRYTCRGICAKG